MSVKDQLASIERYLVQAKLEDEKLEKGVKSAAPKLRASLLEIGKIVSEGRKVALDAGKAIPIKKRVPKEAKVEEALPESASDGEISEILQPAEPSLAPIKKPRAARKPKIVPPAAVPVA